MENDVWVKHFMYAEKHKTPSLQQQQAPQINILHTAQEKKYDFFPLQIWQSNNILILESYFLLNIVFIVRDISKHMDNTEVGALM